MSRPHVKIINHVSSTRDAISLSSSEAASIDRLITIARDKIESIMDKLEDDILDELGPNNEARKAISDARARLRRVI
jgi:hypothetical protein